MTGSTSSNSSNNDVYADKIVQVTNVAPQANKEQMQTLFGIIGKIEDLRLYPTLRDLSAPVQLRICFVKYSDPGDVPVALHLSNTVFIDRAVSVTLYHGNELPDEGKGIEILNSSSGFGSSDPKLPATLTNQIEGNPPHQVIRTLDPRLSIHNLPNYPLLPASTDSRRLEEIRRTVVAINLDPSRSAKQVIDFFSSAGEVKYFRFCTKQGDDVQYAMIEFVEQESVVPALKLNNKQFGDSIIKVHHSTQSIIKPVQQTKSNEAAQKEIEEAVNRVKEAQQLIPVAIPQEDMPIEKEKEKEKVIVEIEKEKPKAIEKEKEKDKIKEKEKEKSSKRSRTRSKSRSRSRHRSTSRSRRRRSRSKSRERRKRSRSRSRRRTRSRSRSKSRDRRKRSRSREKKRSRSRDRRRRSRSRSRSRKEKSPRPTRERRDRSPKERTKDKDREKSHKDKDKDKDRDKEKTRDKDKSRDKDKKDREKKEKKKDKKEREREREREREKKPKSPASKDDSSADEKEISERNSARRSTPPSPPPPSKSKSRRRSKSREGSRGRSR
uniref:EOG090X0EEC n=1 Tax=Daphnia longispina TaxID=42846 RepID=A0A4Y7M4J7_9CRUS|nr:EOG090X0EEC [Daphnia longispina]